GCTSSAVSRCRRADDVSHHISDTSPLCSRRRDCKITFVIPYPAEELPSQVDPQRLPRLTHDLDIVSIRHADTGITCRIELKVGKPPIHNALHDLCEKTLNIEKSRSMLHHSPHNALIFPTWYLRRRPNNVNLIDDEPKIAAINEVLLRCAQLYTLPVDMTIMTAFPATALSPRLLFIILQEGRVVEHSKNYVRQEGHLTLKYLCATIGLAPTTRQIRVPPIIPAFELNRQQRYLRHIPRLLTNFRLQLRIVKTSTGIFRQRVQHRLEYSVWLFTQEEPAHAYNLNQRGPPGWPRCSERNIRYCFELGCQLLPSIGAKNVIAQHLVTEKWVSIKHRVYHEQLL
ncbi:hypothetical protein SISSUDRAFT_1038591, partial [Sistotremastrum suecicum HHB10207 ss-3]